MTKKSYVTITDQFCGAGGSSIGAVAAGAELRLALNHWKLAIETHNSNFPDAAHDCTDISACDPRRYPSTDILITSPECTNHSLAKGKQRKYQSQLEMFSDKHFDPAEERSRATMWDVPRFAEYHDYRLIIVENVVDARMWRLWEAWLHAMDSLGYNHEIVYFNSMFAWPTPQSRDRMYVVFWKRGNRAPDLAFNPPAFCPRCAKNVDAVQSWKNPKRKYGKYRQQYIYLCPVCASKVEPYYYCAANAIDWGLPIERIGDRKKPLKPKTMARIEAGLKKFARTGFVVETAYSHAPDNRFKGVEEALPTQAARQTLGVAVPPPFIIDHIHDYRLRGIESPLSTVVAEGNHQSVVVPPFMVFPNQSGDNRIRDVEQPYPTQTASLDPALVTPPLVVESWNTSTASPVHDPLAAVVAGGNHHYLLMPPWLMGNYSPGTHRQLTDPAGTVTTQDHHSLVVPPALLMGLGGATGTRKDLGMDEPIPTQTGTRQFGVAVPPWLMSYYGTDTGHPISEGVPTVTTVDRHALVTPPPFIFEFYSRDNHADNSTALTEPVGTATAITKHYLVDPTETIRVEDCGFRMLQPHEIQRAMAFPHTYKVLGNSREKVKQLGNAVTPPVMSMLIERCLATLG